MEIHVEPTQGKHFLVMPYFQPASDQIAAALRVVCMLRLALAYSLKNTKLHNQTESSTA